MSKDMIPVPTDTRLNVSYAFDEAATPTHDAVHVDMHGLCHGAAHFDRMAAELNDNGIHTARVDIRSDGDNSIPLRDYVEAFRSACAQIERDTRRTIGTVCGHSMGGQMTQELMQKHPEWRRPTVLMAPVPTYGALPSLAKAAIHNPPTLCKSLKNLDVSNAMRTPDEVRMLFFDRKTPESLVEEAIVHIRHTSYRAYLDLLLRPVVRPRISDTGMPTMLLRSDTDFLFPKKRYKGMRKIYSKLDERVSPEGGHDFFMEKAGYAAHLIARFHGDHA